MKADRDARPDPESFLRLANRDPKRGHLKVYIGQAAGVGKTYKMLDDAHTMRQRGIDVVVAFVEPHGRAETASRIGDLDVVPRRTADYKGATLEEMDLDAVLARRPEVAVVDELAHTNAPGSKNEKRWQDVLDLLAAGISVMTAVNVQHLEGVQDVVKSATGLEVRERVPDRVIREADAVVNVDLPGPELRDRLKQGKIYPPAQAAQALENFFREENLRALRELALRETAENVDHGSTAASSLATPGTFGAVSPARVAVALPLDPLVARALIRRGSRMAGRMNTRWYALYVRRKRDRPENLSAKEHRELTENIQLAISLGATIIYRESEDVAKALLDFAREEKVGVLVLGRPTRTGLKGRLAPGIVSRILESARGIDVLVVDIDRETAV
ncbi:MAG TPA: universal stress protein [Thermoanaerobaculia bacterium]|nr:universal stress protein [Thermoanaerobaculia bacterium]